jgi:hypothetical protein
VDSFIPRTAETSLSIDRMHLDHPYRSMGIAPRILACLVIALGMNARGLAVDFKFDPADDHLIPVGDRMNSSYESVLRRRLFVTRANLGRIIVLPSNATEGETAVSLYSDAAGESRVTLTRAKRNLWWAEFGKDPDFRKGPAPGVTRVNASIPPEVGERIFQALRRAILRTRPLRNQNNTVIVDSTAIVFVTNGENERRRYGLLTPYAAGKNGESMRRLTALLQQYCDASTAQRVALLRKIEAQVARLAGA